MKNIAIELIKMVNAKRKDGVKLEISQISSTKVEINRIIWNVEIENVYEGEIEGACYFLIGFIDSMLKTGR